LEYKLLGEWPGHGEPEELLQDQRLVLGSAHPPLFQVPSVRVLEDVSALVVLDGPPKTPQHGSDLFWVEKREEAVEEHFQLHWHSMEAL
jgi:hypothetical protein